MSLKTEKRAVKEQEDIVRQLTQALNEKEFECSELQRRVTDLKQTQRLREKELDTTRKIHEMRVKELDSMNNALTEQVIVSLTTSHDCKH